MLPLRSHAIVALALAVSGCVTTTDPYTREQKTSNAARRAGEDAVLGGALCAAEAALNGGDVAKRAAACVVFYSANGALAGLAEDEFEAALLREFKEAGVGVSVRGRNVVLEIGDGVVFERDSAQLDDAADRKLVAVGDILTHFQRHRVDVIGHSSSDEDSGLSRRRAAAVKDILADAGIPPGRIRAAGRGVSEPLRDDASEATRALNRRVEIQIAPAT